MSKQALVTGTLTLPASATWWSTEWGAVGVTNGLTTVTGTRFTTRLAGGQSVSFANQPGTVYVISSITSATSLELTTAFTGATNAATAMGFSANPVFKSDGQSRLKGLVFSSVAPATIQVQLSPDGTNWDATITLTLDPGSTTSYSFDINLVGAAFFRLVVTDAGAGSTVRASLYTTDFGSGPNVVGGVTPAAPGPVLVPLAGFQTITLVTGAAASTSLTVPAGATYAYIVMEGDPVRWRDDGTDPTTAVGMLQGPTTEPWFYNGDLDEIEFICQGLAGSTLSVSYYR